MDVLEHKVTSDVIIDDKQVYLLEHDVTSDDIIDDTTDGCVRTRSNVRCHNRR